MESCLAALRSGSSAESLSSLKSFNEANACIFTFPESESTRETLVKVLLVELGYENETGPLKRDEEFTLSALVTLKIISRERTGIETLLSKRGLRFLCTISGLIATPTPQSSPVQESALKCLSNLVFKSPATASACTKQGALKGIAHRLKMPGVSPGVLFFDLRLAFLLTALAEETRELALCDYHMIPALVHVLSAHQQDIAVVSEILKIVFSLTIDGDKLSETDIDALKELIECVRRILCSSKPEMNATKNHALNALVNMPVAAISVLVPLAVDSSVTSFQGHDVTAIVCMIGLLEKALEAGSKAEELVPALTALSGCSKSSAVIRKYLRSQVFPPLGKVVHKPEESPGLKGRLIRLMTSPVMNASTLAADFLFVLCKENVGRLTKHTGYGNAAGLLFQRGLLGAESSRNAQVEYSSDEDSDTEEYLESNADIVTGGPKRNVPNPLDSMTDEEKEAEAEKLAELFAKLNQTGVMKVTPVGPDGRPILDEDSGE